LKDTPRQSADHILSHRGSHEFLNSLVARIEAVDMVIINGEGDMIFTSPPRRTMLFLLALVALSLKLGKKVFFVNTIASPSPDGSIDMVTVKQTADLLKDCAAVAVRDPRSLEFIGEHMPEVKAEYVPDALFLWRFNYFDKIDHDAGAASFLLPYIERTPVIDLPEIEKPYVVIAGSSRISASRGAAIDAYVGLIAGIQEAGFGVIACQPGPGDEFLKQAASKRKCSYISANIPIMAGAALLAGARVFVSGRYHPSILASNGGTPCVFFGSNSHKTSSLQQVLGYDDVREFNSPPRPAEIQEILGRVNASGHDNDLRKRIYARSAACASRVNEYYSRIL
jgi:polysaccharide pyruvyl transferase WcaK-like protein